MPPQPTQLLLSALELQTTTVLGRCAYLGSFLTSWRHPFTRIWGCKAWFRRRKPSPANWCASLCSSIPSCSILATCQHHPLQKRILLEQLPMSQPVVLLRVPMTPMHAQGMLPLLLMVCPHRVHFSLFAFANWLCQCTGYVKLGKRKKETNKKELTRLAIMSPVNFYGHLEQLWLENKINVMVSETCSSWGKEGEEE